MKEENWKQTPEMLEFAWNEEDVKNIKAGIMDQIQARVLLSLDDMLNPKTNIKMFRYWNSEVFSLQIAKINKILDTIQELIKTSKY